MPLTRVSCAGLVVCFATGVAAVGSADAQTPPQHTAPVTTNLYGQPGLIDMPTAQAYDDAYFSFTVADAGSSQQRYSLTFQMTPRITGSFRYSTVDGLAGNGTTLFDRSFDIRYLALRETRFRPAVAIGLQDFAGTGVFSGEYVVATKTLPRGVTLTGGIGFGRLGSNDPIGSNGTRTEGTLEEGGIPNAERWFRGDYAAFGGIAWSPNDRLTFKAEYSSDAYVEERAAGTFGQEESFNYGFDYRFRNGVRLSVYHLYLSEVGFQVELPTNLKSTAGIAGGIETAPLPVSVRAPNASRDLGWTVEDMPGNTEVSTFRELAANEGLIVEAVALEPRKAVVRLRNPRYGAASQAYGRLARAMSRTLPASVETFEIIPVVDGMPVASVTIHRSDVERLENAPAPEMLARTEFGDPFGSVPPATPGLYPRFDYSIAPALNFSVFDPDSPVRYDLGVRAAARYTIRPNVELSGSITQRLVGTLEDGRLDESNLPRVRTDQTRFSREGETAIDHLTLAMFGRPAEDLYSRVTVGYLENMYAGASAEILWKPVDSRLAFGAEVNYVERRDFDQLLGIQGNTTIDPVTGIRREIPHFNGHVSAYYSFGNGFHGRIDAGQYLAGDIGATVSLDREFANGWRVGAYATFTDVSTEDFGEGSFDRGLRIQVPLSTFSGQPSRESNDVVIQSLTRDGGARLNVRDRLYEKVRDYHEPDTVRSWGRFWR